MNPFENTRNDNPQEQDKLLAECEEKILDVIKKFDSLDGQHKKILYEWCCKNAAVLFLKKQ